MEIVISLGIVAIATAIILNLAGFAQHSPCSVSDLQYVNFQLKFQLLLLALAMAVLLILLLVSKENLALFLAPGDVTASASAVWWLGIPEGTSWSGLGLGLSFIITLGTSTFVYLQFRKYGGAFRKLVRYLPWVLLFSLTNSFSEEVIYRLGIIVPLYGTVAPACIMLISAVAFAAPHLRGMPNGLVGVVMAGFLGWLLAKSVLETHGIFWAWFIHFLQDVVIYSAFVMTAASAKLRLSPGQDLPLVSRKGQQARSTQTPRHRR